MKPVAAISPPPRCRELEVISRRRSPKRKAGSVFIEVAICLPLMVLLSLATVEARSMIHLKQSLKIAAYEAARVAVQPAATESAVQQQAVSILDSRRVVGPRLTITPDPLQHLTAGDEVTVSITAPCVPNSVLRGWFYRGKSVTEQVTVMVQ